MSNDLPSLRGGVKRTNMIDLKKCLPSPELQAEFEKFKTLNTEEEKLAFQAERKAKLDSLTADERDEYIAASNQGVESTIGEAKKFIDRADEAILRDKLGELPDIISFSYIAKKYFGKSRNWLYQRINGYTVNGKKAHFTESEHQIFIKALNDVSEMINKTSLKLS